MDRPLHTRTGDQAYGKTAIGSPDSTKAKVYPFVKQPTVDYFFEISPNLLGVINPNGYFHCVNPSWERVLGLTIATLQQKPWFEWLAAADRAVAIAAYDCLGPDCPHRQFQGWLESQVHPPHYLSWQLSYRAEQPWIYVIAQLVSPPPSVPTTPWDSDAQIQHLVETIEDYAIYQLDPAGRIVSWNVGAERIHGYADAEIIGQSVTRLYPPDAIATGKFEQERQIALSTGRFQDESQRVRRDGSWFWVNTVMTPLHDPDGRLTGFAKVTRDITERKQHQTLLQQTNEVLEQRVVERTAELMTANRLLRHEIEERQEVEAKLRRSEQRLRRHAEQLRNLLRKLKSTQAHLAHTEKMSSLGQLVAGVAHEINNPVSFISGNLTHARQYLHDLLDVLALYRQHYPDPPLEIQAKELAIDLDFLVTDLPALLNSMTMGADRIHQIVLSLRNFSRHDQSDCKAVDIHQGLDSTLLILRHQLILPRTNQPIMVEKDYGDLPLVECYPGQLNQVFMNLLSNAIDAIVDRFAPPIRNAGPAQQAQDPQAQDPQTQDPQAQDPHYQDDPDLDRPPAPAEPGIAIATSAIPHGELLTTATPTLRIQTAQPDPNWITIRITDNGIGIRASLQQQLFDPFFTTKPVGKGTGLGLSIAYQIVVDRHHGHLQCYSQPGGGTEFTIVIPLRQTP